jgi:DNA-binding ferritin-like protein
MTKFIGSSGALMLYTQGAWGVVVDSEVGVIVASGASGLLTTSRRWTTQDIKPNPETDEIAEASLSGLVASGKGSSSKYTIPKSVQAEAKKALEWRKKEGRGGTDVGLNTARTLSRGGQIGIEKIRHIAKYFPRHEVDKRGRGYRPGDDGFPSNGRIAWALWGGDAGWRWARTIVEREEKKALNASGYDLKNFPTTAVDADEFTYDDSPDYMSEFLARVRLDGSGMDRLYRVDSENNCFVWDDGQWDDLGIAGGNVWDYDEELDQGVQDSVEKTHFVIDPESAIIVAARLYVNPNTPVTVEDIDEYEAKLAVAAIEDEDWDFIDRTLLSDGSFQSQEEEDGDYTPEERAENAAKQVRNKQGRFAETGSRVVVGNDPAKGSGVIKRIEPETQSVVVELDGGREITVPAKTVEDAKNYPAQTQEATPAEKKTVDTSGILGERRPAVDKAKAELSKDMPTIEPKELKNIISNWPAWVKEQRDNSGQEDGQSAENADAYDHPLLRDWRRKKNDSGKYPMSSWSSPITASAEEKLVSPDTSDVQPVYMAIVDADDPSAVLDVVSLVPASTVSNSPMIYTREKGKWVRDPKTLADLNSPTPPPVVPLDDETLNDVLKQVDFTEGVTASIALTVLYGNEPIVSSIKESISKALRRYWIAGPGAKKIQWGVGGDWYRCVRQLAPFLGVRAKSYCQMLHKTALGYYTSTHARIERAKLGQFELEEEELAVEFTEVTKSDMHTPLEEILSQKGEDEDFGIDEDIKIILSDIEALDYEDYALVAAGGADRNRGGAENLRRYWTIGKGGLKIRWGTPGDWTRCARQLRKYMGARAQGYCALRHKEMNGFWPGDKKNRKRFSFEDTYILKDEEQLISDSYFSALSDMSLEEIILASVHHETGDLGYSPEGEEEVFITEDGETCPPATQDIQFNLANRQNAIDNVGYGPLNPAQPNDVFWQDKAERWNTTVKDAKSARCGNCVFFIRTPDMLNCIEKGIGLEQEAEGSVEAGELGYCNALDFKCASERTCNAWASGGPVTSGGDYKVGDDVNVDTEEFFAKPMYELPEGLKEYVEYSDEADEYEIEIEDLVPTQNTVNMARVKDAMNSDKPIQVWVNEDGEPEIVNGHHRSVAKKLSGEDKIVAKVYKMEGFVATAGSKPAPKKDRIKGSSKNKSGSGKTGAGVTFTQKIEDALATKVTKHNETAKQGRKTNIRTLKAVYRRGAGAFSTSHRPDQNRNSWAMARVNAFLHLLKTGTPKNSKYITDNDLLPASHPKSTKSASSALVSAGYSGQDGASFSIPLVIPEEVESGDGRKFNKGAIEIRELPLPLLWQIETGNGHDGSVVVGRIDRMEQTEEGIGNAYGVFDSGVYGSEAERLVREGFLRGVSADMDKFEATEEVVTEASDDDDNKKIKKEKIIIKSARVMAVTIVPKPAFQECKIFLEEPKDQPQEDNMIPDGIYIEDIEPAEAEAVVASGLIAGSIPVAPPKSWFTNPQLKQPTPLTVTDEGRVYGHIAAWDVDHIGMVSGTRPPRSRSNYSYFHTGVLRTEEGVDVPVGQITLAGGHADIRASASEAVKHYDDTASAAIDVHAGEDAYGIWVAGSLRPGVTPEQVRALRASAPSGDWRPIRGNLELVAVCQVNVPGFPIARAMVASGQVTALIAAGASVLAKMRSNPMQELNERLSKLEQKERAGLIAAAQEARAKFQALRPSQEEPVVADAFYQEVQPSLVPMLEKTLADVVAFTFIAQGYHWNVKGRNFPQYHEFFGEIYEEVHGSIDPLAENILKLGYDAPMGILAYAEMSELSASGTKDSSCEAMAYDLYFANSKVLDDYKEAFATADSMNEQGVADFLAGRIDMHQKWAWQLKASSMPEKMRKDSYEDAPEPMDMMREYVDEVPEVAMISSGAEHNFEAFSALTELAKFTKEEREELAKEGKAMPDGSYPIRNEEDLKNAVSTYGLGKSAKKDIRAHIIKRAKELNKEDLIPENWMGKKDFSIEDMRNRIAELSATLDK